MRVVAGAAGPCPGARLRNKQTRRAHQPPLSLALTWNESTLAHSISVYSAARRLPERAMVVTTCARWPSYGVMMPIWGGVTPVRLCGGGGGAVNRFRGDGHGEHASRAALGPVPNGTAPALDALEEASHELLHSTASYASHTKLSHSPLFRR